MFAIPIRAMSQRYVMSSKELHSKEADDVYACACKMFSCTFRGCFKICGLPGCNIVAFAARNLHLLRRSCEDKKQSIRGTTGIIDHDTSGGILIEASRQTSLSSVEHLTIIATLYKCTVVRRSSEDKKQCIRRTTGIIDHVASCGFLIAAPKRTSLSSAEHLTIIASLYKYTAVGVLPMLVSHACEDRYH